MTIFDALFSGETIRAVLIMSAVGGALTVLLFALKPIIKDRLPKVFQYYLWLVVLAALLVPFSRFVTLPNDAPISRAAVISDVVERYIITGAEETVRMDAAQTMYGGNVGMIEARQSPELWRILRDYVMVAWVLGALIFFGVNLVGYLRFGVLLERRRKPANADEAALLAELCGNGKTPALYRLVLASTPMLVGVFKPTIVLPDRDFDGVQLRHILSHELTHLRRKDVLVKWLAVIAGAAHWFNPLVWLARREISRACELACDEAVIMGLDKPNKQRYGDTLISVVADVNAPRAVLSTTMCEEKKALKERLGSIMKSKKHTKFALIISAALLLAVTLAACTLGASSGKSKAEGEVYENANTAIGLVFPPEYVGKYEIVQYDVGSFAVRHIATYELQDAQDPGFGRGTLFSIDRWPIEDTDNVQYMNEHAKPILQTDEYAYFLSLGDEGDYDNSVPESSQTKEYKKLVADDMISAIIKSAYPLNTRITAPQAVKDAANAYVERWYNDKKIGSDYKTDDWRVDEIAQVRFYREDGEETGFYLYRLNWSVHVTGGDWIVDHEPNAYYLAIDDPAGDMSDLRYLTVFYSKDGSPGEEAFDNELKAQVSVFRGASHLDAFGADIWGQWEVYKFLGFQGVTREAVEWPNGEDVIGTVIEIDRDWFMADFGEKYPQYYADIGDPEYRAVTVDAPEFWAHIDENARAAVGELTDRDSLVMINAVRGEEISPTLYLLNGERLLLSLYDDYFELRRVLP